MTAGWGENSRDSSDGGIDDRHMKLLANLCAPVGARMVEDNVTSPADSIEQCCRRSPPVPSGFNPHRDWDDDGHGLAPATGPLAGHLDEGQRPAVLGVVDIAERLYRLVVEHKRHRRSGQAVAREARPAA